MDHLQRKNHDVGGKGRFTWIILQWEENDTKTKEMTNEDFCFFSEHCSLSADDLRSIPGGVHRRIHLWKISAQDQNKMSGEQRFNGTTSSHLHRLI